MDPTTCWCSRVFFWFVFELQSKRLQESEDEEMTFEVATKSLHAVHAVQYPPPPPPPLVLPTLGAAAFAHPFTPDDTRQATTWKGRRARGDCISGISPQGRPAISAATWKEQYSTMNVGKNNVNFQRWSKSYLEPQTLLPNLSPAIQTYGMDTGEFQVLSSALWYSCTMCVWMKF